MKIKNRILAFLCLVTLLCGFALSSCDGGGVTPIPEPEKGDEPLREWFDIPESYCIKIEELTINLGSRYDGTLTLATLYVGTDGEGELFGEGYGTLTTSTEDGETVSSVKACFDKAGGYLLTSDLSGERLSYVTRDEVIGAVNGAIGGDIEQLVHVFVTSPLEIIDWLENDLFLALGAINYNSIIGDINDALNRLFDGVVSKTRSTSDNTCLVSIPVLYDLVERLNSLSVKELYEYAFGDGSFRDFKTSVAGSLTLSLSELVEELESTGARRDKIFAALDSLAAILLQKPEATVEELLGIDGSLEEKLSGEEAERYTVSDLLMEITGASGPTELSFKLEDFYTALSENNLFRLLGREDAYPYLSAVLGASLEGVSLSYVERGSGIKTDFHLSGNPAPCIISGITYDFESVDLLYSVNGRLSLDIVTADGRKISAKAQLISDYRDESIGLIKAEIESKISLYFPNTDKSE